MIFREKSIKNQKYIVPTWSEMGKLCFELAKKVIASKMEFDRIVALAKGGWTWARTFADYLAISNLSGLQVEFYQGIRETSDTPKITQPLSVSIKNEKILLFDDVSDSGATLTMAKKYLLSNKAKSVTTATLFVKPWTSFTPEFYGAKTSAWVIFPHEIREMIELLNKKWEKQGLTKEEIKKNLVKIGISKEEVEYFLTLQF